MIEIFQAPITSAEVKAKARSLGADLVGIADGKVMDEHPPDPRDPHRPSDITELDADRVIVLAKHYTIGTTRLTRWDERHKYYNDELTLSLLEETSLELVYWLEDKGYPAIIIPPSHVDPWRYQGDPRAHMSTILSHAHAAVEAGFGNSRPQSAAPDSAIWSARYADCGPLFGAGRRGQPDRVILVPRPVLRALPQSVSWRRN